MTSRRDELAANLERLEKRLTTACAAAGRSRDEITLIAVTKTFPADDIRHLVELGVTNIGENRDQEARAKAEALSELAVTWHFVGQLQSNKCRSIAQYADVVHAVDRDRVVSALSNGAHEAQRRVDVLIQVSLDEDPARGGAAPATARDLAVEIAAAPNLRLRGVMAVAPLGGDASTAFAELARVAFDVRSVHPEATVISAGMSGDLEAAIQAGATHVRIGTALLGVRSPPVR
ncbi:MAG: dependent protein [Frankiales bacterium]|jgi:pyridoxal phosphate enzyme (YggS family)|nr:dependent protein [Frankiales bacterium]